MGRGAARTVKSRELVEESDARIGEVPIEGRLAPTTRAPD